MTLKDRFWDILTTGDITAAGDADEGVVLGVLLHELLEAVCAERIVAGGDHDWPTERVTGFNISHSRNVINGPCEICGTEVSMSLRRRFTDILDDLHEQTPEMSKEDKRDCLQKLLEAVCVQEGHDWPMIETDLIDDTGAYEKIHDGKPCRICGGGKP